MLSGSNLLYPMQLNVQSSSQQQWYAECNTISDAISRCRGLYLNAGNYSASVTALGQSLVRNSVIEIVGGLTIDNAKVNGCNLSPAKITFRGTLNPRLIWSCTNNDLKSQIVWVSGSSYFLCTLFLDPKNLSIFIQSDLFPSLRVNISLNRPLCLSQLAIFPKVVIQAPSFQIFLSIANPSTLFPDYSYVCKFTSQSGSFVSTSPATLTSPSLATCWIAIKEVGSVQVSLYCSSTSDESNSDMLLISSAPVFTRISPSTGPSFGGSSVEIYGDNFASGNTIYVELNRIRTPTQIVNNTFLTAVLPFSNFAGLTNLSMMALGTSATIFAFFLQMPGLIKAVPNHAFVGSSTQLIYVNYIWTSSFPLYCSLEDGLFNASASFVNASAILCNFNGVDWSSLISAGDIFSSRKLSVVNTSPMPSTAVFSCQFLIRKIPAVSFSSQNVTVFVNRLFNIAFFGENFHGSCKCSIAGSSSVFDCLASSSKSGICTLAWAKAGIFSTLVMFEDGSLQTAGSITVLSEPLAITTFPKVGIAGSDTVITISGQFSFLKKEARNCIFNSSISVFTLFVNASTILCPFPSIPGAASFCTVLVAPSHCLLLRYQIRVICLGYL